MHDRFDPLLVICAKRAHIQGPAKGHPKAAKVLTMSFCNDGFTA
jgi:hypothetical protein